MKRKEKQETDLTRKRGIVLAVLAAGLACSAVLALRFGSAHMDGALFRAVLFGGNGDKNLRFILFSVRLPRVLAGILAGVGFSLSGVLLQGVTGNPLASPNIIGVNSGAGFAVMICLSFFPGALYALPFAAFIGAFSATLAIVGLAGRIGASKSTFLLAGIALTALLNAGISFLSLLDTDVLSLYSYFSVGGLSGVQMQELRVPAVLIGLSFAAAMLTADRIQLLCLGDSMALSLGVRVRRLRIFCLVCASAAAAAAVSFAGLLGFVGLVVPHMARKLVGERMRPLIGASALLGGMLVLLADLAGRVLMAPSELPVGIVMAAVGCPFFFVLLMKKGRDGSC